MNFTPKAVIFAEEQGFTDILKTFLFKCGLRETVIAREAKDLAGYLHDNFWPIVFIDHSDGHCDGFATFEGIYKTLGFELLPYVFVAPPDKRVYQLFGLSAGARGIVKKPLQPNEASLLIKQLMPPPQDSLTSLALQVSKVLLKGELAKAMPALTKLQTVPQFKRGAEIALVRCEIALGHHLKAEERLQSLLKVNEKDLRVLSEVCDFFKRNGKYSDALKYYNVIHSLHPRMTLKVWDQILLHLELDQLDEAVTLLDELQLDATFREPATDALLRILLFMGIGQFGTQVARQFPGLAKQYNLFVNNMAKVY